MQKVEIGTARLIKNLFHGETKEIIAIFVYALGVGLSSLAVPIAVQSLVNSVSFGTLLQPIVVLSAIVGGVLIMSGVIRLLQLYVAEFIQRRLVVRIGLYLSKRLPHVIYKDFYKNFGPDQVLRFMEVFTVQKVVSIILLDGVGLFFQFAIGLILVSFYHPFFLAFSLIVVIAVLFVIWILGFNGIKTCIKESTAKYEVLAWLQDITSDPTVFKSFQGERYALTRTDNLLKSYLEYRSSHFKILFRQNVGAITLQILGSCGLLFLGGLLVIKNQLTLGQLVSAELIFSSVLISFTKIGKHLEKFYDLIASLVKLEDLANLPYEDIPKETLSSSLVKKGSVTINLHQISSHSKNFQIPLFKEISLSIYAGQKILVVGDNSSGKSTLADILYRMANPTSGWVEIDGINIKELSTYELRSKITLVRDIETFHGSLYDNLTVGKDVERAHLREVLKRLNLLQFIETLQDGFETVIKGNYGPFSKSQAIRLMLARGLLTNPDLLIIDGTLDPLDSESIHEISKLLTDKANQFTLILLTHNDSIKDDFDAGYKLTKNGLVKV